LQVVIIQFGGIAFFTVPLTADQWLLCILFGISELLFGQVSFSNKICRCSPGFFAQYQFHPASSAFCMLAPIVEIFLCVIYPTAFPEFDFTTILPRTVKITFSIA
jgi:hypothetical protein